MLYLADTGVVSPRHLGSESLLIAKWPPRARQAHIAALLIKASRRLRLGQASLTEAGVSESVPRRSFRSETQEHSSGSACLEGHEHSVCYSDIIHSAGCFEGSRVGLYASSCFSQLESLRQIFAERLGSAKSLPWNQPRH
jgi:hypothetical protein